MPLYHMNDCTITRPLPHDTSAVTSFPFVSCREALPLFPEVVASNGINASGPSNVKDWILPYVTERRCDTYNGRKDKEIAILLAQCLSAKCGCKSIYQRRTVGFRKTNSSVSV